MLDLPQSCPTAPRMEASEISASSLFFSGSHVLASTGHIWGYFDGLGLKETGKATEIYRTDFWFYLQGKASPETFSLHCDGVQSLSVHHFELNGSFITSSMTIVPYLSQAPGALQGCRDMYWHFVSRDTVQQSPVLQRVYSGKAFLRSVVVSSLGARWEKWKHVTVALSWVWDHSIIVDTVVI